MKNLMSRSCLGVLTWVLLTALALAAGPTDQELLKSLPEAELALKDTLDHWGLPFSDQLRRFQQAQQSWLDLLGADAPKDFMLGTQHGLEKIPKNKYWFKGTYGNRVHLQAARNESESFQVAVLPAIGKQLGRVTLVSGSLQQEKGTGVIPAAAFTIYRVGYVQTVPPQYPVLYVGPWPDVLLPNGPLDVARTDLGLFWVDVKVPRDAASGAYHGQLTLEADGHRVPVQVALKVHSFALPDRVPFPIAVWTGATWPPPGDRSCRRGSTGPAGTRSVWSTTARCAASAWPGRVGWGTRSARCSQTTPRSPSASGPGSPAASPARRCSSTCPSAMRRRWRSPAATTCTRCSAAPA